MIVVTSSNPAGSIIHLVVGPETELFMDVNGAAVLEMAPVLAAINPSLPIYLTLCRCRCEEETADMIRDCGEQGSDVPIKHNVMLFGHVTNPDDQKDKGIVASKMLAAMTKPTPPPKAAAKAQGTCSRCLESTDLIPKIKPGICYSCAQIDLNRTKPHVHDTPDAHK